jgi:hypothetical protein
LYRPGDPVAHSATEVAIGNPQRFEIRVLRKDGSLRQIIRVLTPPKTSTSEMLAAVRQYADSAHKRPPVMEYIGTLQPGDTIPAFGQLRIDRAGRIWIGEYQPPAFLGPRSPVRWTLSSARGEPLARIAGPADVSILELGDDYMLGLSRDSLGVELVRLFDMRRRVSQP